jgi:hypothetical protein
MSTLSTLVYSSIPASQVSPKTPKLTRKESNVYSFLDHAERVWKDSYSNSIPDCPLNETTEHLIFLHLFSHIGAFTH